MKARGYEPTMDGMDDHDIKDAVEVGLGPGGQPGRPAADAGVSGG